MIRSSRFALLLALAALLSGTGGCASYVAPGGAANMQIFADYDVRTVYRRQPASPMPARLAFARVQAAGYRSYTNQGYGSGEYSVVTVRDVEKEDDFKRIAKLPDVDGIGALNRLLIGNELHDGVELRRAAASVGADMLVLYTFDTAFHVDDAMRPLTVISLGLFPTKVATVTTTASSLLIDVRTGYIYATGESTAQRKPLANAWTSDDAVDQSRQATEREAFLKLIDDFERVWPVIASERKKGLASK